MTHSNFNDWIEGNVHIPDITETWSAYHTILEERSYYPFEFTKNGMRLFIVKDNSDDTQ